MQSNLSSIGWRRRSGPATGFSWRTRSRCPPRTRRCQLCARPTRTRMGPGTEIGITRFGTPTSAAFFALTPHARRGLRLRYRPESRCRSLRNSNPVSWRDGSSLFQHLDRAQQVFRDQFVKVALDEKDVVLPQLKRADSGEAKTDPEHLRFFSRDHLPEAKNREIAQRKVP